MYIKIVGAIVIVGCCGGYGVLMAMAHRKDVAQLRDLIHIFELMHSELEYRLTPIPELCRLCAADVGAPLSHVLLMLADKLDAQSATEVSAALNVVLEKQKGLGNAAAKQLQDFGQTLGRFDLPGQLRGLRYCTRECEQKLRELEHNQQQRLRGYQTLGFCAGAALAILLF